MSMSVGSLFSMLSALLVTWCYIPYAKDIMSGRAKPARSARLMLTILLVIALLQQIGLDTGWTVAVTIGETVGSIAILLLAFRKGVGGFTRVDMLCYLLLVIDMVWWLTTRNTFLALHLTILADTIAFYPTLIKIWNDPHSETPLFFIVGAVAPLLNIIAVGHYSYTVVVFPFYLALANGLEVIFIYTRPGASNDAILTK